MSLLVITFVLHLEFLLTITHYSDFGKWHCEVKVFTCQESFKQFAIISIASSLPPPITNKVTRALLLTRTQSEMNILQCWRALVCLRLDKRGQKLQEHIYLQVLKNVGLMKELHIAAVL